LSRVCIIVLVCLSLVLPWAAPVHAASVVRVGIFQSPPLNFVDEEGRPQGLFVDILGEIARQEGWRLRYVPGSWAECLQRLRQGSIDVLLSIAYTPRRARRYDFNRHTVISTWGQVYVRRGLDIQTVLDLAGKTVAVLKGDIYNQDLRRLVREFEVTCRFREVDRYEQVFALVQRGEADVGAAERLFGDRMQARYSLRETPIVFSNHQLRFGFPKGTRRELIAAVDRVLGRMKAQEGSPYYQALDRWLVVRPHPRLPEWLYWVLVTLVGLGLLSFLVSAVLRRQVRRKTAELAAKNQELAEGLERLARAEADLRASRERYRTLVDNLPYGLFIADCTTARLLFVNPRFCQLFGYDPQEILELTLWDLALPSEHEHLRALLRRYAAGEEASTTFRCTGRRKDGSTVRCEVNVSSVPYQGQKGLQGVTREVTAEEMLERQLVQAQKMEAVGTLASGVAHEFNNILMAIRGYAQLLATALGEDPRLRGYLDKIEHSARRAADLTSTMLSFSRLESGEKRPVDLTTVVKGVVGLLKRTLPPHIELVLEPPPKLPPVLGNPNHLEQVLLNLAVNARDAMPEGGRITVRLRWQKVDAPFRARNPWARAGSYCVIEVSDTGSGMPPEVLSRIFEPFFTTKEPGRGTGLGLAVAYRIVENHQGVILAESSPGQGSTFYMYLPAMEQAELPLAVAPGERPLPQGQGRWILVVDDEPPVREISREALESVGYLVSEAAHGQEALDLYRRALRVGRPFDLVILDLGMPVMDGRECLHRILEIDPQARVVVTTGYTQGDLELGELAQATKGILEKPFDLTTLIHRVGEVLASLPPRRGRPAS